MITDIAYCSSAQIEDLNVALAKVASSCARSILMLACDKDDWGHEHHSWLQSEQVHQHKVPIFGGVFPYLLYQGKKLKHGSLIIGLSCETDIHIAKQISTSEAWTDDLEKFSLPVHTQLNLIVIADGLAKNIERVSEEMYQLFGARATTVGCGAGSLDFVQKPCVISLEGLLEDAVLIGAITELCGLGVGHGWEAFSTPLLVTESNKNCICSLNYQPAFDVYKDTIEGHSDFRFDEQTFFEIAKTYPFGISSIDGELLVRDPIAINNNKGLLCVGEVPQNTTVYLLQGKPELLIASAGLATKLALNEYSSISTHSINHAPSFALIFDCISRCLFLDKNFPQEINTIESTLPDDCVSLGALTLGEICTSRYGPIELLNKSIVVAIF